MQPLTSTVATAFARMGVPAELLDWVLANTLSSTTYLLGEVAGPAESSCGADTPSPITYLLGEVAGPAEK